MYFNTYTHACCIYSYMTHARSHTYNTRLRRQTSCAAWRVAACEGTYSIV